MSKTFSKKIDKTFDVSFSSTFFGFIAVMGVSQRWEFKNTTKKRFTKKIVSKSFNQKIDQKSKIDFFRFFLSRFWAFLGEGSTKKPHNFFSDPGPFLALVPFWPLTHPPTTGVTDFLSFFSNGPLAWARWDGGGGGGRGRRRI
jgi:hypothetical protein